MSTLFSVNSIETNFKTNTTTTDESTTKQATEELDIDCMNMTSKEEEMNTDVEKGILMDTTNEKTSCREPLTPTTQVKKNKVPEKRAGQKHKQCSELLIAALCKGYKTCKIEAFTSFGGP